MRKIKRFKDIGIEAEFSLILISFLVFIIVSQAVLIFYAQRNINEQRHIGSALIARQINSFLTQKTETLNKMMYEVRSDPDIAAILDETDAGNQKLLIENYTKKAYEIQNYVSDVFYVVVCDQNGNFKKLTPNISASEYESLCGILEGYEGTETDGEVSLFEIDGAPYTEHRYIYVTMPITEYDYLLCKEVEYGKAVLCMKVDMGDVLADDKINNRYENINISLRIKGEEVSLIDSPESETATLGISGFYITNTGWEIVGKVRDNTGNMLYFIKSLAYINIGLTLLLMLIFRMIIIREVLKPVSTICEFLKAHGLNETSDSLTVRGNRDIKELASVINSMYERVRGDAHRIFYNQQALYEREMLNVETQLRLLQNQVNPHFIYNTFETIRSIADFYEAKEICVIINALNKLLRYNLDSESRVKIADEINIIKNYIEIMEIRYEDAFTFECECDGDAAELPVLKMICQPIVENCFVHGFRDNGEKLNVSMTVTASGNRVIISIKDNGRGMSAEKRNELLKKFSNRRYEGNEVGVGNLIYRLRLCYNDDFDFQILSEENAYTVINISIPCDEIAAEHPKESEPNPPETA